MLGAHTPDEEELKNEDWKEKKKKIKGVRMKVAEPWPCSPISSGPSIHWIWPVSLGRAWRAGSLTATQWALRGIH